MLDRGLSPNTVHPFGWTPLHAAVVNHNARAVSLLLDRGADVNAIDIYNPRQHGRQALRSRERVSSIQSFSLHLFSLSIPFL